MDFLIPIPYVASPYNSGYSTRISQMTDLPSPCYMLPRPHTFSSTVAKAVTTADVRSPHKMGIIRENFMMFFFAGTCSGSFNCRQVGPHFASYCGDDRGMEGISAGSLAQSAPESCPRALISLLSSSSLLYLVISLVSSNRHGCHRFLQG